MTGHRQREGLLEAHAEQAAFDADRDGAAFQALITYDGRRCWANVVGRDGAFVVVAPTDQPEHRIDVRADSVHRYRAVSS